jgi:hypothetical protein
MDEEVLNMQVRKFLKKVGIASQREIEQAVRRAVSEGKLSGNEKLSASMTLRVPELGVELEIAERLALV